MKEILHTSTTNTTSEKLHLPQLPEPVVELFQQLDPQQVEQLYQSYQYWLRQQQATTFETRLAALQQQITDNEIRMQLVQPSAIAFAVLARLQSCGVEDVDLLDSMLERGDTWLDHTMQQLECCERLGVIQGDYTTWCMHALEGAYDWLDSMNDERISSSLLEDISSVASRAQNSGQELADKAEQTHTASTAIDLTEAQLLQKLMSEGEEADGIQEETQPVMAQATQSEEPAQGIEIITSGHTSDAYDGKEVQLHKSSLIGRLLSRVWQ